SADVYKYKKSDGTVVYTDNLAELPPERREHYNKLKQAQEQKRAELERAIGKEELERREAEAKKAEVERAALEESERQARLRAIDAQLKSMQDKRKEREAVRESWAKRMRDARQLLDQKLAEFRATTEKFSALAMKPSHTLLPGEGEELEKLRKALENLEKDVDAAIELVDVTIPEEARKAGIPPGYLR
ncbi:hypothetical protein L6R52_40785, partial [Myxococcota bacterium]|nr:hypothetical protein [Myxococcota bacterium]